MDRRELLITKRDAFLLAIVFEDLDGDFVADIEQFGWMVHAAPGQIRDVKQSIDTTQIDKHAVIGDVLHDSADFGIFLQRLQA